MSSWAFNNDAANVKLDFVIIISIILFLKDAEL